LWDVKPGGGLVHPLAKEGHTGLDIPFLLIEDGQEQDGICLIDPFADTVFKGFCLITSVFEIYFCSFHVMTNDAAASVTESEVIVIQVEIFFFGIEVFVGQCQKFGLVRAEGPAIITIEEPVRVAGLQDGEDVSVVWQHSLRFRTGQFEGSALGSVFQMGVEGIDWPGKKIAFYHVFVDDAELDVKAVCEVGAFVDLAAFLEGASDCVIGLNAFIPNKLMDMLNNGTI
jgi:hypothetical protein